MKNRMIVKTKIKCHGSEMRSPNAPFETECVNLLINGVEYTAFENKKFPASKLIRGCEYDISFISTPNTRTLRYPILIT